MIIREYKNDNPPKIKKVGNKMIPYIDPPVDKPLPNLMGFRMVIAGAPGRGKSTVGLSLLRNQYRGRFDNVYVIMPSTSLEGLGDRDPIKIHCQENPHKYWSELNDGTLSELLQDLETNKFNVEQEYGKDEDGNDILEKEYNEPLTSIVFIDDMSPELKKVDVLLSKLFTTSRHLNCCIILLCHCIRQLPTNVRKNMSHIILFKPANKKETECVDEVIPLDSKDLNLLFDYVFKDNHDFLYYDVVNSDYFKNFNRLEIE